MPVYNNYHNDYLHLLFCIVITALSTTMSNCMNGDVRLQDGPNVREGRVEVCINNAWGTVCDDQFGVEDAIVTCTQMKFSDEGNATLQIELNFNNKYTNCMKSPIIFATGAVVVRMNSLALHGSPNSPIFLTELGCQSGTHNSILECEAAPLGITTCLHEDDAVVHCEGIIFVSVVHFE